MTSQKMIEALNKQIYEELNSFYIYAAMAADFEAKGYNGFSGWMKKQAEEEMAHAWKIYGYIYDRSGKVNFKAIGEPKAEYPSVEAAFEEALAHEKHITKCIEDLVKLARKEDDLATESFLRWFIDEQVEEEANAQSILDKITMIKGSANGLYLLDKEMGQRK